MDDVVTRVYPLDTVNTSSAEDMRSIRWFRDGKALQTHQLLVQTTRPVALSLHQAYPTIYSILGTGAVFLHKAGKR
jgi:hypothetical protein